MLMDSLIICKFLRGVFDDFDAEAAEIQRSAIGLDVSADELRQTTKRIVASKRQFNLLAGWTPAEDTLSQRFLNTPPTQRFRGVTHPRELWAFYRPIPAPARVLTASFGRQARLGERLQVVLPSVEIPKCAELAIDRNHFLRLHSASSHGIE